MTKKIFNSIFLASFSVLLAAIIIIFGVLYGYFTSVQKEQIHSQLMLAKQGVIVSGERYFDNLSQTDCRITWIDADGKVIRDTHADSDTMDNHLDRKEVQDAIEVGVGEDSRYSATLMEKTFYIAHRLPDNTIIRVSATQNSIVLLLLGIVQPFIIVLVLSIILAAYLARRMSKKVVEPLNQFDLDKPLENEVYDELSPMVRHIESQRKQIQNQVIQLKRDKEELTSIIEDMGEGLVVLNNKNIVLNINPSAEKIFGADKGCIGQDVAIVDRSAKVLNLIDEAVEDGHAEAQIERNGRVYRLHAGKMRTSGTGADVILLAFDITEMYYAEQNRREFTANVSHELKTPLQNIMGSAELIENGLVKKDDMPQFIGRIRTESARLLDMIQDIIRLSQLDERQDIIYEDIDLNEIIYEVAEELHMKAEQKNLSVSIDSKRTPMESVGQLVHEIVYNLFDNAIKYNVTDGKIKIKVYTEPSKIIFEIADTGIGIPAEAQNHVFERFYRVDKSRTKTNGTGLGLSIVKHAAYYLNASIDMESVVDKGTTIRVVFPIR